MLRVAMHANFASVQNTAARGIFDLLYGPASQTLRIDDAGIRARSLATLAESHTRGNNHASQAVPASPTAESLRAEKTA